MNGFRNKGAREPFYLTAYGEAVKQGFQGTAKQWLESLIGPEGPTGKSAYEYAKEAGYLGTEEEFARKLADDGKSAYEYAVEQGFQGTETDFAKKLAAIAILILNGKKPKPDGSMELTAEDVKALPLTGGKLSGALDLSGNALKNVQAPVAGSDAANLNTVQYAVRESEMETQKKINAVTSVIRENVTVYPGEWQTYSPMGQEETWLTTEGFTVRAEAAVQGALPGMIPYVTISSHSIKAAAAKLANEMQCTTGGIYLYAKPTPAGPVVILTAECRKRVP